MSNQTVITAVTAKLSSMLQYIAQVELFTQPLAHYLNNNVKSLIPKDWDRDL